MKTVTWILTGVAVAGVVWWARSEYKKAKAKRPNVKIVR